MEGGEENSSAKSSERRTFENESRNGSVLSVEELKEPKEPKQLTVDLSIYGLSFASMIEAA